MKDSSKKSALFQLLGLALIFVILSAYVLGSFYVRSRSEARDYIEKKFISAAEDRGNQVETRLSGLADGCAHREPSGEGGAAGPGGERPAAWCAGRQYGCIPGGICRAVGEWRGQPGKGQGAFRGGVFFHA